MIRAWRPLSRKYSAIAVAENGARYCIGAASEAVAATMIE
jgi:predicted HAD superfamily phosphohydrolase